MDKPCFLGFIFYCEKLGEFILRANDASTNKVHVSYLFAVHGLFFHFIVKYNKICNF